MPRQLLCIAREKLEWREYDEPALGDEDVRIRSEFSAAKHGTEMGYYHGYAQARGGFESNGRFFTRQPAANPYGPSGFPVGNMAVGRVIETGAKVESFKVGDRILCYGGFRPTHVRAAGKCWKLPEDVSWKSAVCLDPADFALGAVRDGHVRVGDGVAVLGMGAIGLMVVQLARLAGASPIIASEPIATRRELARKLGADMVLDSSACDVGMEIRKATGGRGADVVIDYSGSADALQDALRGVAYGGTVVAGACPSPYPAGLDLGAESHMNIPQIVFSRACSQPSRDAPRWNEQRHFTTCLRLICEGKLRGEDVVTPVVSFDRLAEEYPKIATELRTHIKLGASHAKA